MHSIQPPRLLARGFARCTNNLRSSRRICYIAGVLRIPMWLTLGVAGLVIVFGLYRVSLAFRGAEAEARARQRKGMFALAGRTHFLIGVIYLLLGGALVATTFGWNPLAGAFGTEPAGAKAPKSDGTLRVEPRK